VQQATVDSRVLELWESTLAPGETLADLRSATYDLDGLAKRGMHFERLDQLALEYLYGVR
jgi:xylose isomerase